MTHPVLRLVRRNLTVSINPGFLVWQILFPLIYIFIAGFAYASIIDGISFGTEELDYPSFLATGMIGFNIMNSTLISGVIIWHDRRHGMFEQILSGSFTRFHYVVSNIITIGLIGLLSAFIIAAIGLPVFFGSATLEASALYMIIFAAMCGSIFFGSIASILSTRLKSSEEFNVTLNTFFLFFGFASTAFYPATSAPEPLATIFYLNPLTYLVDIIRAGVFGTITDFVLYEMAIMAVLAAVLFATATRLLARLDS